MGQKVNPISFRLIRTYDWASSWYANTKEFGKLLIEDQLIRRYLEKKLASAGIAKIKIKRKGETIEVTVVAVRPALIIGKKGVEIDSLKAALSRLVNKEVWVAVEEVKRPDMNAKIVADSIAKQIERRIAPKRAMKKAIQSSMDAGSQGIRVQLSGRIGGAEIARVEKYKEGSVPLHTIRANIDYASVSAQTVYGKIGVKVWINCGEDHLVKKGA
jgi:small subunit ribosomal protein S3